MKRHFKEVWTESISRYGVSMQSVVCMEECCELIEACDDLRRLGHTDATRAHLIEEMADVRICLGQLELMYGLTADRDAHAEDAVGACASLAKAVSKVIRYGCMDGPRDRLAIAMGGMARQLELLQRENDISQAEMDAMVEYKTDRQAGRMSEANQARSVRPMRLHELTGQESGIVVRPNGETIVANWGDNAGLPSLFMDDLVFTAQDDVTVVGGSRNVDLSRWLDRQALDVLFDRNGDLPLPDGVTGDKYVLSDGTVVLAPEEWA